VGTARHHYPASGPNVGNTTLGKATLGKATLGKATLGEASGFLVALTGPDE